jgi:phage terminase large subunit-like protein
LELFPWQQFALRQMLGERADGKWAAFEAALLVPRQNGKGSVIEAYELANLFLFDAQLIIHSAHLFPTAQEAFRRLDGLIQNCPSLRAKVRKVSNSHGSEGIELKSGGRIRFMARTVSGAGRGFSPDRLVLDEAFRLPAESVAAVLPSLSAQPNPQILYTSSTGYPDSEVLRRLVERGRAGGDRSLCYLEHSAVPGSDRDDPVQWAVANPSMGYLFDEETVARERATLSDEDFDRERLGHWADGSGDGVFNLRKWAAAVNGTSQLVKVAAFAVDISPDQENAAIAAAGTEAGPLRDPRTHVEVVETGRGNSWIVARCVELSARHGRPSFVVDTVGPASALIDDMTAAGLNVRAANTRDVSRAYADMVDAVEHGRVVHGPQQVLEDAIRVAKRRPLGDGGFALGRRVSSVDISPLVAVELAHWAAVNPEPDLSPINNVW